MSTFGGSEWSTASSKTERGKDYWAEKEAIRDAHRSRKFHARQSRLQAKHLKEWDTPDPETTKIAFHHAREDLVGNAYIYDPQRPETVRSTSTATSPMPSLSPRPYGSTHCTTSPHGVKFCVHCGGKLAPSSKPMKFCVHCGGSLEPTSTPRGTLPGAPNVRRSGGALPQQQQHRGVSPHGRKHNVLQAEEDDIRSRVSTQDTFYNGYHTMPSISPHHSQLRHEDKHTDVKIGHPGQVLPYQSTEEQHRDDFGRYNDEMEYYDDEGNRYYDEREEDEMTTTPPGSPPPGFTSNGHHNHPPTQPNHGGDPSYYDRHHQARHTNNSRHPGAGGEVQNWLHENHNSGYTTHQHHDIDGYTYEYDDTPAEIGHQQHSVEPSMTHTVAKDCPFCGAFVEGDHGALHIYQCKKKHTPKDGERRAFR